MGKLADRARAEEWSYEHFLASVLKTETDSRESHGGQARIKTARFPARKTLEEFDFAFQASLPKNTVLHLGQLGFLAGRENVVLLGPPGTGDRNLTPGTSPLAGAAPPRPPGRGSTAPATTEDGWSTFHPAKPAHISTGLDIWGPHYCGPQGGDAILA